MKSIDAREASVTFQAKVSTRQLTAERGEEFNDFTADMTISLQSAYSDEITFISSVPFFERFEEGKKIIVNTSNLTLRDSSPGYVTGQLNIK